MEAYSIEIRDRHMIQEIQQILGAITPFDQQEEDHLHFTRKWIESGAEIFRIAKPATPDPHLVAYFLLLDLVEQKILLGDHKKSGLWLPAGGHVELNEHPKETVKREAREELKVEAEFLLHEPFFLTVSQTVGITAGHTDVSMWYLLKGSVSAAYDFDAREFFSVEWFSFEDIPYTRSDPHMVRAIEKLKALKICLAKKL